MCSRDEGRPSKGESQRGRWETSAGFNQTVWFCHSFSSNTTETNLAPRFDSILDLPALWKPCLPPKHTRHISKFKVRPGLFRPLRVISTCLKWPLSSLFQSLWAHFFTCTVAISRCVLPPPFNHSPSSFAPAEYLCPPPNIWFFNEWNTIPSLRHRCTGTK